MKLRCIVSILFVVSTNIIAQSTCIAPGVMYEHITRSVPKPLSMHLITVDPTQVNIVLEASHQRCTGSEKVTDIAQRTNAIAAINGGFFDFGQNNRFKDIVIQLLDLVGISNYNAFPVFALKIKDQWFSLSTRKAGAFGWKEGATECTVDILETNCNLKIDDTTYEVKDINKPYAAGPILYTSAYDKVTPIKTNVLEIVIEKEKIKKIVQGQGGTVIPQNGYIYALDDLYQSVIDKNALTQGMHASVQYTHKSTTQEWQDMTYIVGSTPLLIKNGTIVDTLYTEQSPFYTKRHPRTAMGILADGKWLFVVVDGRQKLSKGLSIVELAFYMQKKGCIAALNLDGGGSSTLVIHNKLINSPSGREYSIFSGNRAERPLADAVLILPASKLDNK